MRRLAWTVLLPALLAGCSPEIGAADGTEDALTLCAKGPIVKGIDVSTRSQWDPAIDWGKVSASGVGFAFIRVSDGVNTPDRDFAQNWDEAKQHGVLRGAYQFFRAEQDPLAQADMVVNAVGKLGPGDLPAVLDLEVDDNVKAATLIARVQQWLDRVEQGTGKTPIVYTGWGFWGGIGNPKQFSRYPLWVANYGVTCPKVPEGGWPTWTFWQNSKSGKVPGRYDATDLDVFNGSMDQLFALAR